MIYFDNAATTKPDKNALEFAKIYNEDNFFNPSALYVPGINTNNDIELARKNILKNVCDSGYDIIFTSCGTESDNTAVFSGVRHGYSITTKSEHSAIYKSFLTLKQKGNLVEFIEVDKFGSVNEDVLYEFVKNNKVDFVSIMHVNNETGAINDINKISAELKKINPNLIFHSDGVQAFGKIPFKLAQSVDLYSISAHKINGLKGVGALIKKKNINLSPYIIGGGQENNLRSGTENVFGIKVLEHVTKVHYDNIENNYSHVLELNNYVRENIDKDLFNVISSSEASPYILSISAIGLKGEIITHLLERDNIYVGNGSACSAKNPHSRVIKECGYGTKVLDGVIRISFSQDNTLDEVKILVEKLNFHAKKLKGIMRWEMPL